MNDSITRLELARRGVSQEWIDQHMKGRGKISLKDLEKISSSDFVKSLFDEGPAMQVLLSVQVDSQELPITRLSLGGEPTRAYLGNRAELKGGDKRRMTLSPHDGSSFVPWEIFFESYKEGGSPSPLMMKSRYTRNQYIDSMIFKNGDPVEVNWGVFSSKNPIEIELFNPNEEAVHAYFVAFGDLYGGPPLLKTGCPRFK